MADRRYRQPPIPVTPSAVEWVKLAAVADIYEAELIAGRLAEAGIGSETKKGPDAPGAWLTGSQSSLGPIELYVPSDRVAEARNVLELSDYMAEPMGVTQSGVSVVRVFTDENGLYGNPLGLVEDAAHLDHQARQELAAELAFSETVFIDDVEAGRIQIFTPTTELPFAGHPIVGTSWFLRQDGWTGDVLRPPAGDVRTWDEGDITWIEADPAWAPQDTVQEFPTAEQVNALTAADCSGPDLYAWAWIDEATGGVRARYFAPGLGIEEDEATGSAAVLLGWLVERDVTISQGEGSVLYVRAPDQGRVAVGGRVRLDRP